MSERDPSDSQILARFPGFDWMPRWTRKHLTPQTAIALTLALFSAGSWVGTYLTAPDVRALTKSVSEIQYVMGPRCVRDCVLRTSDLTELKNHVEDLWKMRVDIDAELARQELEKAARAAKREPPKPEKRGKVHAR